MRGMYSDMTVSSVAGRFRVRWHHSRQAVGSTPPVSRAARSCNYVVFETASSWHVRPLARDAAVRYTEQAHEYVRELGDHRPGKEGWDFLYVVEPGPVTRIRAAARKRIRALTVTYGKKLQHAGKSCKSKIR